MHVWAGINGANILGGDGGVIQAWDDHIQGLGHQQVSVVHVRDGGSRGRGYRRQ